MIDRTIIIGPLLRYVDSPPGFEGLLLRGGGKEGGKGKLFLMPKLDDDNEDADIVIVVEVVA